MLAELRAIDARPGIALNEFGAAWCASEAARLREAA
jgi:hypothetical protein